MASVPRGVVYCDTSCVRTIQPVAGSPATMSSRSREAPAKTSAARCTPFFSGRGVFVLSVSLIGRAPLLRSENLLWPGLPHRLRHRSALCMGVTFQGSIGLGFLIGRPNDRAGVGEQQQTGKQ